MQLSDVYGYAEQHKERYGGLKKHLNDNFGDFKFFTRFPLVFGLLRERDAFYDYNNIYVAAEQDIIAAVGYKIPSGENLLPARLQVKDAAGESCFDLDLEQVISGGSIETHNDSEKALLAGVCAFFKLYNIGNSSLDTDVKTCVSYDNAWLPVRSGIAWVYILAAASYFVLESILCQIKPETSPVCRKLLAKTLSEFYYSITMGSTDPMINFLELPCIFYAMFTAKKNECISISINSDMQVSAQPLQLPQHILFTVFGTDSVITSSAVEKEINKQQQLSYRKAIQLLLDSTEHNVDNIEQITAFQLQQKLNKRTPSGMLLITENLPEAVEHEGQKIPIRAPIANLFSEGFRAVQLERALSQYDIGDEISVQFAMSNISDLINDSRECIQQQNIIGQQLVNLMQIAQKASSFARRPIGNSKNTGYGMLHAQDEESFIQQLQEYIAQSFSVKSNELSQFMSVSDPTSGISLIDYND